MVVEYSLFVGATGLSNPMRKTGQVFSGMRFLRYFFVYLVLAGIGFAAGWGVHKMASSPDGSLNSGTMKDPASAENNQFKGLSVKELIDLGLSKRKEKKYREALTAFQAAYDRSEPGSVLRGKVSYLVGVQYFSALGTPKDLEKARTYFSDPRAVKNKWSIYYLGMIFSNAKYAGRDIARARSFLLKAEKLGVRNATRQLEKIGRS